MYILHNEQETLQICHLYLDNFCHVNTLIATQ